MSWPLQLPNCYLQLVKVPNYNTSWDLSKKKIQYLFAGHWSNHSFKPLLCHMGTKYIEGLRNLLPSEQWERVPAHFSSSFWYNTLNFDLDINENYLLTLILWSLDLRFEWGRVHAPVNSWSPSVSKCSLISDGDSGDELSCFTYTTSWPPKLSPTTMWVPYFSMKLHTIFRACEIDVETDCE